MLKYRHKLGPSYTFKERVYIGFAFVAAILAGFGTLRISHEFVDGGPGDYTLSLFLGLIAFFGAFGLMAMGIDHVRTQRVEHEVKEYYWSRELDQRKDGNPPKIK